MNRMEVPIKDNILYQTGDLLLRAELGLLLRDAAGNWTLQTFRVDSGSDISAMPAYRAKVLGLAMPQQGLTISLTTAIGQQNVLIRSGYLRLKVDGLSQTEHIIPCHFRGDPDTPPPPGTTATGPYNLLGLAGVIDKLRFTFDGTPLSMSAPYGILVVEEM